MNTPQNTEKPTRKVYRDLDIFGATYIGGPLVAGYMIAENFKTFNDADKARKTLIYAIIITIALFVGVFLIPEDINIPRSIIPITYTAGAFGLVQAYQKQKITKHIELGGGVFSWFKSLLIGLIGLFITLVLVFAPVSTYVYLENSAIVTQTYGVMKNEISFDNRNIAGVEAEWFADAFRKTGFFDQEATKYVYLKKIDSTYELSLGITEEVINDAQIYQNYVNLRNELQSGFPDNKIVFKLVIDSFENVVKIIE